MRIEPKKEAPGIVKPIAILDESKAGLFASLHTTVLGALKRDDLSTEERERFAEFFSWLQFERGRMKVINEEALRTAVGTVTRDRAIDEAEDNPPKKCCTEKHPKYHTKCGEPLPHSVSAWFCSDECNVHAKMDRGELP